MLERAGTLARAMLVLAPIALLFGALALDHAWSDTRQLRGVVTGLSKRTSTRRSLPTQWVVKLAEGPTLELPGTEGVLGYAQDEKSW